MKLNRRSRLLLRLQGTLFVVLLLAVLGAAGWLARLYNVPVDWSTAGAGQLTPATRGLLKRLDGPVVVWAFMPSGSLLSRHVRDLVDRYHKAKPDLTLKLVDPQARPELVRRLDVAKAGELVIQYKGDTEHVKVPTEPRISGALAKLAQGGEGAVRFLTGHGERSLAGQANFDLGSFGDQLRRKGYTVTPLKLGAGGVPADTLLLVIASPQIPLLPGQRDAIIAYLHRGGNLLLMADPEGENQVAFLMRKLGLGFVPGVMVDPSAKKMLGVDDPRLLVINQYPQGPVTEGLNQVSLFPGAAALKAYDVDWTVRALINSGGRQWSEQGDLAHMSLDPDQGDVAGPLPLGVTMVRTVAQGQRSQQQRVAVIGDGDFLSNTYIGNGANLRLGLSLVDWLSRQPVALGSYVRATGDQTLDFSATGTYFMAFGFLLGVPGFFLLVGGVLWLRRRRG